MDELYDAISSGVEPGGLRSKSEIKMLICYLINRLDYPFTKEQIIEIICSDGIANYFEVSQALSEVVSSGNITLSISDSGEYPQITPLGRSNIEDLQDSLPLSVKEQALNNALNMSIKLKREQENKIEITDISNGCKVKMSITDGNDELMTLEVYAADHSQADYIKSKFLEDPVRIYSNIVSMLMA